MQYDVGVLCFFACFLKVIRNNEDEASRVFTDESYSPAKRMERGSDKEVPLVNGGRDGGGGGGKAEEATGSGGAEVPGTPERQPCLPPSGGDRPGSRPVHGLDDVDKRRKVSSANSMAKNRASFDKGSGGGGRLGSRVEARLRRRTGLSRVGLTVSAVILALLLIFLIVIVVLACTWPQTPHAHLFPVCTRAACLQASAQILPKMDASAAPCEDFWHYACGGWLRAPSPPRPSWSLAQEQALRYREHLRTLVTTLSFPTDPTTKEWKLQHMYESCMRLDSIETDGLRPLEKLIAELGGWIVLPDFSPMSWNSERTTVRMFTTQRTTPFFQMDVVPDPRNKTKSIVKIVPGGLDLPDKSFYFRSPDSSVPSAFMQFLKDIITSLGAKSTDARRFSENVFFYEKRIANDMPDITEREDPVANSQRMTIGYLRDNAGQIPLLDILQLMFPKAAINNETEILVPSSKYMSKISAIISTTDRGQLNEYMMWILAASYVPYLNSEIREMEMAYNRAITGAQEPTERWEMCISTLEEYMGLALATLAEQSSHRNEKVDTKKQINQMFDNIRDAVRSSIAKAYWFDKDIQQLALDKISTMTLQIGISSPILSEDYLKRFYEGLHIQRSDFFRNIRNAREFQLSFLDKKLMDPREEYQWIEDASIGKKVSYIPTANKVVIPQWLLSPPLYHSQYPLSVQYGGLGAQIAYAVVSGVLPQNILYDAQGVLLSENSTIVNQSVKSVKKAKAFIIRDMVQNGLASQEVANRTALTTVIQIAALRQAHMALVEALSNLPHMHQPAMESYESEQLFFLTHAQSLCSKSSPQQRDIDVATSQHLNGSQLLPVALKQLREFSQAFSCPSTSVHYSSNIIPDIL